MASGDFDEKLIKEFLLEPEKVSEEIEERLMTDEQFFERVLICEDELIEEYAEGALSEIDRKNFEQNFLVSEERVKKLMFTRALRSASQSREPTGEIQKKMTPDVKSPLRDIFAFFLSPVPAFGGLIVVFAIASFAVWHFYLRGNGASAGADLLSKAYQNERPFMSRISEFSYAPKSDTRGNAADSVNKLDLERASRIILDNAAEEPSAANLHNLGKLYLSRREFDNAIEQFEKSESLEPNRAGLQNDFGVALLEKAQAMDTSNGKKLELYGQALSKFERSAEVDPKFAEARFNKALTLQIYLPRQAAAAWREYLALDPNSKWAEEAKRNLEKLESSGNGDRSAEDAKAGLLDAFERRDNRLAIDLLSNNRDIIIGKHLAQNLIETFLASDGEPQRAKLLQAIEFAGDLEKRNSGDFFLYDLVRHLKTLNSPEQFAAEYEALKQLRSGFEHCVRTEYGLAREDFIAAAAKYRTIGNEPQKMLSDYFVAYTVFNLNGLREAERSWIELEGSAEKKNYKWILANNLYWLGSTENMVEKFSRAEEYLDRGLKISESIGDDYLIQRFLSALAQQNSRIGDHAKTLEYLEKLFERSARGGSLRQKWRNYSYSLSIMGDLNLTELAEFVARENIIVAEETGSSLYLCDARNDAAIAYADKGNFDTARAHLTDALNRANGIEEEYPRKFMSGRAMLIFGQLERKAKNYPAASEYFKKAAAIFAEIENNPFRFETAKGKLLTALALGDVAGLESDIRETIELAEKYRREIADEQKRSGFADSEQTIYDIAAEFEFSRGELEAAYEYVETSSSRSLLDWLARGAQVSAKDNSNVEILLQETTKPFSLSEIRAQLAPEIEILQFAVLDGKLLIFLISRDDFKTYSTDISGDELTGKVKNYLKLLPDGNRAEELSALSRELYRILIEPANADRDRSKILAIVPGKILFHLPFAALESSDGTFLIKDQPILLSPSANVLLLSSKNAAKKSGTAKETLVAVGNPDFSKTKFPDLQDLPAAEREVDGLSRFYPVNRRFSGNEAGKTAVLSSLNHGEVIHFAGHYVVNPTSPLSSSLVLAGEDSLSNADLIAQKLSRPRLVVVSACDTGIENYYRGEGLVGLSRSFLASGVPVVVGSQWKVDSDAAAELMIKFHENRKTLSLSTPEALRRAQLELMESSPAMKRPFYWAAFSTIGGFSSY